MKKPNTTKIATQACSTPIKSTVQHKPLFCCKLTFFLTSLCTFPSESQVSIAFIAEKTGIAIGGGFGAARAWFSVSGALQGCETDPHGARRK